MIKLGTNILSQTVQRNLGRASQDLSRASERLSSGQRINRASDDAAGLAISMSLDKDRILARTAQRNVSDGISMVSIMSAGLKSQKEILFRMAELAEQSANGTYSTQQREVLQKEYGSLMDEFDRIADSSEFNGVKLLRNVTPQTIQFMAGITGADSSLLQVVAANSHRYAGMVSQRSNVFVNNRIDATDTGLLRTFAATNPAAYEIQPIATQAPLFSPEMQDVATISFEDSLGRTGKFYFLISRVRGDQYIFDGSIPNPFPPVAQVQSIFYGAIARDGEAISGSPNLAISFGEPVNKSISVSLAFPGSGATASISIDISGTTFESFEAVTSNARPSAIGFTNLLNRYSARRAVNVVTNRIDDISSIEGQYGAVESRLNVAHNLLATSGENFAAAASRIKDADIASEAANSVRSGILQQAATSLLAQANQAPRIALSLLSGI